MSPLPIARSADLQRLQNEGYDLEIRGGFLLVKDVPYVAADQSVGFGILIVRLDLNGDVTRKPDDHVAYWSGEHPCHSDGSRIRPFEHPSGPQDFGNGIRADFMFSAKADYRDYHHKVTTYVGRISGEAAKIDPSVTPRTFPLIPAVQAESVFNYVDTASSRSGIGACNSRIAGQRIGIIGLGGTGSYVLDFVSKTPVREIHLFDQDVFSQHNAFRAPGAAASEQLAARPRKVAYFAEMYGHMRRGIIAHDVFLDASNLSLVNGLDFVFVCMDGGPAKRAVVDGLLERGMPFVEVGMGLYTTDGAISGLVRVSTVTPESRDQALPRISFVDGGNGGNEYSSNIQISELNGLNASLAVIRWKKLFGFYRSSGTEFHSGYAIAPGQIACELVE